jgi:hypothetical protein
MRDMGSLKESPEKIDIHKQSIAPRKEETERYEGVVSFSYASSPSSPW